MPTLVLFYGQPGPVAADLFGVDELEIGQQYKYIKRKGNILYAEIFMPTSISGPGRLSMDN